MIQFEDINSKIFSAEQVRQIDKYTIENEPIESIDLMERAARALFEKIKDLVDIEDEKFSLFIGAGNNGGDGLALARMLVENKSQAQVYILTKLEKLSVDCKINLERFQKIAPDKIVFLDSISDFPAIDPQDIVIDSIFGSGLKRPVSGFFAEIIDKINELDNLIIAIDIPSGLYGEDNSNNIGSIIKADMTITLQFPFISMMFAENYKYVGDFVTVPIGLHEEAIQNTPTDYYINNTTLISNLYKPRKRFDHKGSFGHALLIAGSYGKAGAALLAAKACMKAGAGLVTAHVPADLCAIIQTALPEAMISIDSSKTKFTQITDTKPYNAIGIGPGLGTDEISEVGVIELLKQNRANLVIDADGLNILSKYEAFADLLPEKTILTPHPKEFERMFGEFENTYQKMQKMQEFSVDKKVIIVYKSGISIISLPDGKLYFNTNGNPGMATGGSGDVLTGIILSLLAQNYEPETAALMGVYIHALAGDLAEIQIGQESIIASDIIDNLYGAFDIIC